MGRLMPAVIPETELDKSAMALLGHFEKDKCKQLLNREITQVELDEILQIMAKDRHQAEIFLNDIYQVARYHDGAIIHLSIKRRDRRPIHNWRHLQEIKNQLVGEENEGLEIYPAESRKVDGATQYHLWCFADPTVRIPIGFAERVVSDVPLSKSVNNPISEEDKARNQKQPASGSEAIRS